MPFALKSLTVSVEPGSLARGRRPRVENASDGDSSVTQFGESITPNFHRLARQFVTLDNFMDSGDGLDDVDDVFDALHRPVVKIPAFPTPLGEHA